MPVVETDSRGLRVIMFVSHTATNRNVKKELTHTWFQTSGVGCKSDIKNTNHNVTNNTNTRESGDTRIAVRYGDTNTYRDLRAVFFTFRKFPCTF